MGLNEGDREIKEILQVGKDQNRRTKRLNQRQTNAEGIDLSPIRTIAYKRIMGRELTRGVYRPIMTY